MKQHVNQENAVGDLMKDYDEEERLLSQAGKRLIPSITIQNRTLNNPLFLF